MVLSSKSNHGLEHLLSFPGSENGVVRIDQQTRDEGILRSSHWLLLTC